MKPAAFLYCQHSLGMGHFVRSLALAQGLADHFDLTFINGGPLPEGKTLPDNVRFEHLPPLRMAENGLLEGAGDLETIFAIRRDRLVELAKWRKPSLLIVELYPFGRKKFAVEIDPLIAAVRANGGKIVSSVRDVLVSGRLDQALHDERAATRLNALFDRVLVHSDERIFALGESFHPETAVKIPIRHTGYVVAHAGVSPPAAEAEETLVTAGGGAVGHTLYEAAIEAQPLLWETRGWPMTLVAGPLFPDADWNDLEVRSCKVPGLTLHRSVPSMAAQLQHAGRVVSQCGYNSALEIAQSGVPVLYVPFARGQESEQTARAERFKNLGLCDWVAEDGLDGPALVGRLMSLKPNAPCGRLDMDGAAKSAQMLMGFAA